MAIKKAVKLNFNSKEFLKHYWQKKPLLIQQAYKDFKNPITADELAGLACEQEAEARIITKAPGRNNWQLQQGPFLNKDFKKLPPSHWTLLVQATNHWVPELQALLADFCFLPQWRIDDIMTSFAVKQGSVGPHIDNYDVFLLQAEGQREWRISDKAILADDFVPHLDVKILKQFTADKTYILNPGDILYLPPRFAHYGIALNNGITHSIGFRAPSHQEMIDDYFMHRVEQIDSQLFYNDPDINKVKNSGEIDAKALQNIMDIIRNNVGNDEEIKRWFGRFISQSKYMQEPVDEEYINITANELKRRLKNGEILLKNPASRFAYIKDKNNIYIYADGEEFVLNDTLEFVAKLLCEFTDSSQDALVEAVKNKHFVELIVKLIRLGHYKFHEI